MIRARAKHAQRPLRFVAAGAANTAFGLALYPVLLWSTPVLQRHYLLALGIAQAVSLCFAFATYKLGVFRTRGNIAREFGAFFKLLSVQLRRQLGGAAGARRVCRDPAGHRPVGLHGGADRRQLLLA